MPKDHHRDVRAGQPGDGKSVPWKPHFGDASNPVFPKGGK